MSDLREKIARAMFEAYDDPSAPSWEHEYPSMQKLYYDQADAVLAVLREDEGMVERAADGVGEVDTRDCGADPVPGCAWSAAAADEDRYRDNGTDRSPGMNGYIELSEEEMKPEEKNEPVSITRSEPGGLEAASGDLVSYVWSRHVEAFRAYFQAERDKELGRVRDDEYGVYLYPLKDSAGKDYVRVVVETNGLSMTFYRNEVGHTTGRLEFAAEKWFAAHPPKRELPTALGAIVSGDLRWFIRTVAGDVSVMPWTEVRGGGWYDDHDLLEIIGPDWTLVHEGMVTESE